MSRTKIKFIVKIAEPVPSTPDGLGTLTFDDEVPSVLCSSSMSAEDPTLRELYAATCQRLIQIHYKEIEAASTTKCIECTGPRHTILQTPMSWLHLPQPFIYCFTVPVCKKGKCEFEARTSLNKMLSNSMGIQDLGGQRRGVTNAGKEVLPCGNCGKVDQTRRCGKCKLVAYCDKDCQAAHWKVHKRICAPR